MTRYSLQTIAAHIGATLHGDGETIVSAISPLQTATPNDISFLKDSKYASYLADTKAGAVIVTEAALANCNTNALVMVDPYVGYAKAASFLFPPRASNQTVHASAVIATTATIASGVEIGAQVVIGENVSIATDSIIGPGVVIGDNCQLGEQCVLHANVTLYQGIRLGHRVILHSGVVIGADGFGLANDQGRWIKIPQLGAVIIHDDVEIGANTTIDRGALDDTVIGQGVKLDNQIQVGHNVTIGEHTAIAACSGISGSVDIGKHCMISGMVGFTGHFKVTDNVMITGQTMVSKGIDKPGVYSSGTVMESHDSWKKNAVRFRQLDKMAKRVKQLETQVAVLALETD